MKHKDYFIIFVSILVFIGLLIFIQPTILLKKIQKISLSTLVILTILFITDLLLRVVRWFFLLLSQEKSIPFHVLIYPMFGSSFLNLILPGRLGELVRLYALKDEYDVSYSAGLSVIVVEQVINMMGLIIVSSFALGLMIVTGVSFRIEIITQLVPFVFLGSLILITCIIILFVVDPNRFIPLFSFLPEQIYSKVVRLIHTFRFGLQSIKKKFYIFWVALGCSMIIWFLEGVMIWLLTRLFIDPRFEFPIALFASTVGNLNFLFPLLPGAVGTYELFLALILSLSPHYKVSATSIPFTDRIIKTSILAILGLLSLAKLDSNTFNVLSKKTDEVEKIEEAKDEFAD